MPDSHMYMEILPNGRNPRKKCPARKTVVFLIMLSLPAGQDYYFRYLLDGGLWENDWAADAYVPNPFGTEDSVLKL